jgi:hypothetical protein
MGLADTGADTGAADTVEDSICGVEDSILILEIDCKVN